MAVRSSRSQHFCLQHLIVLVGGVVLSEKNCIDTYTYCTEIKPETAHSKCFQSLFPFFSTFLFSTLSPSRGHTGYWTMFSPCTTLLRSVFFVTEWYTTLLQTSISVCMDASHTFGLTDQWNKQKKIAHFKLSTSRPQMLRSWVSYNNRSTYAKGWTQY